MTDVIFAAILGHLFGDYLTQTNWMALNKKKLKKAAIIHCLVYTLCVSLFLCVPLYHMGLKSMVVIALIFLTHYMFDATEWVEKWLQLIGSRSYKSATEYYNSEQNQPIFKAYMIAYTALVQTVADNTLHLACLYAIIKFFGMA